MNDLIKVPTWNNKKLLYLMKFDCFHNGVMRESCSHAPPRRNYRCYNAFENKEVDDYFRKFLWDSEEVEWLFKLIQNKKEFKWQKFCINHFETFILKCNKNIKYSSHYWEIKESIISYIEQKYGFSEELNKFKVLFEFNSDLSFEGYLDKKSKHLLSLDLEAHNEHQEKKYLEKVKMMYDKE